MIGGDIFDPSGKTILSSAAYIVLIADDLNIPVSIL